MLLTCGADFVADSPALITIGRAHRPWAQPALLSRYRTFFLSARRRTLTRYPIRQTDTIYTADTTKYIVEITRRHKYFESADRGLNKCLVEHHKSSYSLVHEATTRGPGIKHVRYVSRSRVVDNRVSPLWQALPSADTVGDPFGLDNMYLDFGPRCQQLLRFGSTELLGRENVSCAGSCVSNKMISISLPGYLETGRLTKSVLPRASRSASSRCL